MEQPESGFRPDTSRGFTDLKRLVNDAGEKRYMCPICFGYFTFEELADCDDPGFTKEDICAPCAEIERAQQ